MSDLRVSFGDDLSLTVNFTNSTTGQPVDDSGAVYTLNVRSSPTDTAVLFQATAHQSAPGVAQIALSHTATSSYTAPAVWAFDVEVTQSGGAVTTLDKGKFYLDPESGVPDTVLATITVSGPAGPAGPAPAGGTDGQYVKRVAGSPAWASIVEGDVASLTTDLAARVLTSDARLSDQRTPLDNSVTSAKIVDGTIVDADISASAAIAYTKISGLGTAATHPATDFDASGAAAAAQAYAIQRAHHTGTQLLSTISDAGTAASHAATDFDAAGAAAAAQAASDPTGSAAAMALVLGG